MPLSWDPRRMWSDNPSAGASKDLPNEEIGDSPKAAPTAFTTQSDSPKRFRFVKGASRPKKRRRANSSQKDLGSRAVISENSSPPEVVLRTAQNLEGLDDHPRGNSTLAGLEPQEGQYFDDFSLFDSILPNIFASTPFLDIEAQETVPPELPGLSATPGMTPLSISDRSESALQNPQASPMAQNIDQMFPEEAEQGILSDLVPRNPQEPTVSSGQSRVQNMPAMSEISSNDHEKLLELCKRGAQYPSLR
ncbi:hypothetical protein N7457_007615 [Penicillium paradoxum]|uniref:uncharacterized protein n=1 Tax=Penicillium paradoxum TaxID=176176 RepID=UPI0025498574|nr:uncharacterized protein N7457_007615 [Penicillium paradoxum]KAJ5779895.1 hypothetical protein N7457_007615 [Penicillium paradoxum]